jgi:hypothetical protein
VKRLLLLLLTCTGCARGCDRTLAPVAPQMPVQMSDAVLLPEPPTATFLRVPHLRVMPQLSRHDDEPAWHEAAWTGPFLEPGRVEPARPYSNARLLWTHDALLLSLYAADEDVRSVPSDATRTDADAFEVQIASDRELFTLRIGPKGVVKATRAGQAWQPNVALSVDIDGALDDPSGEDDEEWVVFAAIPWQDLGLQPKEGLRLHVAFGRCDTPRDGGRRCGQWGEGLGGIVELGL